MSGLCCRMLSLLSLNTFVILQQKKLEIVSLEIATIFYMLCVCGSVGSLTKTTPKEMNQLQESFVFSAGFLSYK